MKKNYVWATDIHLDMLGSNGGPEQAKAELARFCSAVREQGKGNLGGLLLSGDISTSVHLQDHLLKLVDNLSCPVFFVCGNHDFYGSGVAKLRTELMRWCGDSKLINYMTLKREPVCLGGTTFLVGDDGWYDASYGDVTQTQFFMNDWRQIEEFSVHFDNPLNWMQGVISTARKLAEVGSARLLEKVAQAVASGATEIMVLTHFPPFAEAARHQGQPCGPGHLPWYSSRWMGETLLTIASKYQSVKFKVFCGHTHSQMSVQKGENLSVFVGAAEYYEPKPCGVITVLPTTSHALSPSRNRILVLTRQEN